MTDPDYIDGNFEIIQTLMQIPSLRSFKGEELKGFLHISKIIEYKAGDLILEQGNFDDGIYYIVSGQVKIVKNGKELMVLKRTGDVFGEIGVITGSTRSASVYAKEDTVCLAIDISRIDTLSKKNRYMFRSLLFQAFSEILANRLKETTNDLMKALEMIEELKKGG